jgi:hypothetical protein
MIKMGNSALICGIKSVIICLLLYLIFGLFSILINFFSLRLGLN